ncbi:ATP-grasp domain-containing protein [Microbulbifer taiwanensis]|uniref:ATP-grasp domain-containing protein n=1 Tax=Microbulbifer taiwanensis TaxID=986746 RepID=A0ABW1YTD6_9GAMM|nr:ATP-grasp domain-containing protein [Microbulbifer taiwanensis]
MEIALKDSGLFAGGFSQDKLLESDLLKSENDFSGSPFLKKKGDIDQLLITEKALELGLYVKFYRSDIYSVSNGRRSILFCQTSAMVSEVYRFCAQLKHVTKEILSRNEVPVPPGEVFESYRKALRYFESMSGPVVVKPVRGSHGRGITTGVIDEATFRLAWDTAKNKSSEVIVEKHLPGCDIRVNVIGGQAVSACFRIPANVVGDGSSTIKSLVDRKNERRKGNPAHLLMSEYIKRFDLLELKGVSMEEVPAAGERVWLSGVANVSVGGEGIQLIEHLDPAILRMAERAAKAFPGVYHVGVDVMVPAYDKPENCTPFIIEVNTNSATSAPVFPNYGNAVDLPELLLNHLLAEGGPAPCFPAWHDSNLPERKVLSVAAQWDCEFRDLKVRKRLAGQKALIRHAASRLNLKFSEISGSVASVECGEEFRLFHRAMPDNVLQGARRACVHNDLRAGLLEKAGVNSSLGNIAATEHFADESPVRYRLLVIGGHLVAGLERSRKAPETGDESGLSGAAMLFGEVTSDVSESIHVDFSRIAVGAVDALFGPFLAGVDIIAKDISAPATEQAWMVTDVVSNPALGWHHFPVFGKGRDVAGALLAALFPRVIDERTPLMHFCITVEGDGVNGAYRRRIRIHACERGIVGELRAVSKKSVEIAAQGTPVALSSLLSLCSVGNDGSSTFDVHVESLPLAGYEGFEIRDQTEAP